MPDWACVNGAFSSIEEASVPINDRGLVFGDSVYEVLHAHNGRLWAEEPHYCRLANSLRAIGIPADLEQIRRWVDETLRQSSLQEAMIYLQVSRGVAPRDHAVLGRLTPTVIITVRALPPMSRERWLQGVKAITVPDYRWRRRDIKSTNLLPNILAKQAAAQVGAYEAILVEPEGTVTEGSSTNVFLVKDGELHTPPTGRHILPGVTRGILLQIAAGLGWVVQQRRLALYELYRADELFLTGTTTEALGVVELDGCRIGSGQVGPLTRRLYRAYWEQVHASAEEGMKTEG